MLYSISMRLIPPYEAHLSFHV
jgi:hypothetical protein